ncbi:MAG: PIN domain-containing protein [Bacteroidota bacterium]|nr:PIN domain-containing protein [Bacteroidota bacterium]
MPDKVFIDTNILIYASLENSGGTIKRERSKAVLGSSQNEIIISVQVLNESYYVLQRNGLSDALIQKILSDIVLSTQVIPLTENTIRLAWDLKNKYQFSI